MNDKIVKLNYHRKVRYLFDNDSLECQRLSDIVMDHYGEFLPTPHQWDMTSHARFFKELRTCGYSVNEFLSKKFPQPPESVDKPKRKPRKSATVKKDAPKKTPPKKPTVKRKTSGDKPPAKKKLKKLK